MTHSDLNDGSRTVILRNFFTESEASIYAARLNEANIPSFISNAHTGTMIPIGGGSISLHVREKDAHEALEILQEMDQLNQQPTDESFHDADHGDILYQKRLHQMEKGKTADKILFFAIMIILALLIVGIFNHYWREMRIW